MGRYVECVGEMRGVCGEICEMCEGSVECLGDVWYVRGEWEMSVGCRRGN